MPDDIEENLATVESVINAVRQIPPRNGINDSRSPLPQQGAAAAAAMEFPAVNHNEEEQKQDHVPAAGGAAIIVRPQPRVRIILDPQEDIEPLKPNDNNQQQ